MLSKTLSTTVCALVLAGGLTACSSPDDAATPAQTKPTSPTANPATSKAPVGDGAGAAVWSKVTFAGPLPLDEFFPTGHDLGLRNKAGVIAVNKCLAQRGLPAVFTPITPSGITDSHSDIFGYLGPDSLPNRANYPKDFESVLQYDPLDFESYQLANASPDQLAALGGKDRAPDGCLMQALNQVHPSGQQAIPPNYQKTIQLQVDAILHAQTHPDVVAGLEKWAGCMTKAGHTADPMDPYVMMQQHQGSGPAAEADLGCKQETNLVAPWRAVLEQKHQELLAANASDLEQAKKYLLHTRAEIAAYLAANG